MNEGEKEVVIKMIDIYCQAKHGKRGVLCKDCYEIKAYAMTRLDKCPFGEEKPTCKTCSIHCYKSDMKLKIKEIMRFSGPRMLFVHPKEAIRHMIKEMKREKVKSTPSKL
ncbi:MAG: nitrous oxide-stimulated promoter family protein [Dysgonamonadaceae bacterium]